MNEVPEEFDSLRKLLKLKRFEVPPPRFFDELPARILSAIEVAPVNSTGFLSRLPVLGGFFRLLEQNALVAGTFVTGLCAVLIGGVVYSEVSDQATPAVAGNPSFTAMNSPAVQDAASVNPILPGVDFSQPAAPSLFPDTASSLTPMVRPVNFTVPVRP